MSRMGDYAAWLDETGRDDSGESRASFRAALDVEQWCETGERPSSWPGTWPGPDVPAWPGRAEVRAWVRTWAR